MQIIFIIFSVLAGIQVIYLLVFLIALSRKKGDATRTQSLPVSIVICAHDEEQNLHELVPQLLAQDYPDFEIVVIDDRSNDNTFDWLLEETKKDHRLRMVHVNRTPPHVNGKKYGITLGIKAAKYEWILLTDADCRPQSNQWLNTVTSQFSESTNFVLGTSPYLKVPGLLNFFIRFETLLTAIQYFSFALLGNPYMGVGRNMAYRKSMFLDKKGFNNYLNVTGGDDDLFVNQHATGKNTRVVMGHDSLMFSIPKTTWSSFFKQKIRHLSVGKLYKFKHRFLLGLFTLTWMLTWFVGIPLLFVPEVTYLVAGILVFRIILLTILANYASKKLGHRFEAWIVPLLDFIYAFYYLVTGLTALVSKKVRWKN